MPPARGRRDAVAPSRLLALLAAVLVAALLLGPLAGCGVGAQDRGEPAPLPQALPTPPRPPGSGGGEDLVVYLVSGTSPAPVRRAVPERRPQDAVDQLLAGPTRAVVLALAGAGLSGCGDEDDMALAPNSPAEVPDVRGEDDLDDPYTGVLDPAFYEDLPAYAGQEVTLLAEVAAGRSVAGGRRDAGRLLRGRGGGRRARARRRRRRARGVGRAHLPGRRGPAAGSVRVLR